MADVPFHFHAIILVMNMFMPCNVAGPTVKIRVGIYVPIMTSGWTRSSDLDKC